MKRIFITTAVLAAVLAAACVTINVYFPAAAAEQAADRIIEKVQGQSSDEPTSFHHRRQDEGEPLLLAAAHAVASFLVADAQAQGNVDFDKPSPEKTALENSLAERFPRLRPYFDSGAIGMNERGLVEIRDRNLIPLKDRNTVLQLVAAQNKDWDALYAEIARLNGHPEWVDDIRRTFASRWIVKSEPGWYYRQDGTWKQK
jgi:uncharacterized protein YdbL (DUF1318 family)